MRKTFLALCIVLLPGSQLLASRVLKVPPISLVTVHGGYLKNSHGDIMMCATAGMTSVPLGEGGVACAYHQLNFHLKNLSPKKTQHIAVSLEDGTYVMSSNSSGSQYGASVTANPSRISLNRNLDGANITIPPDGSVEYRLTWACNNESCNLYDSLKGELASAGPKFKCDGSSLPTPRQVCIDLRSLTIPVFTVTEDEGAIVGTVTTVTHRVEGWTDFHLTSPGSYPLNGGRPF